MNCAIEQLQRRISDLADPEVDPEFHARLTVRYITGKLYLDFCGSPFDEPFNQLCACLVLPEVAAALASLSLRSPNDVGANGTRNWDLSALADADVVYPNLGAFAVEQARPGDHNRTRIAADYDEAGVLGRLLWKAPALHALTVPSAPDRSFFEPGAHPLRYLSVDAGYDTQGFIGDCRIEYAQGVLKMSFTVEELLNS